jgi:hypothetical protein
MKHEGILNTLFNTYFLIEVFSDIESLIATKNINYKNLQKYLTTVATSIGIQFLVFFKDRLRMPFDLS